MRRSVRLESGQRFPVRAACRHFGAAALRRAQSFDLTENSGVDLFVEADEQRIADTQGWRSQIAGTAEHREHCILAQPVIAGKCPHLSALGDMHPGCPFEQPHCVFALQLAAGRNGLRHLNISRLQKLGGPLAAGSAAAEVIPIDAGYSHCLHCPANYPGMLPLLPAEFNPHGVNGSRW